jgi:sugar phosphate isomerase/epimerase
MQLCLSTLACPTWTLPQILAACQQHHIHGIDFRGIGDQIDITQLPPFTSELDATLATLRATDLSMPCLNTSITLVTPAPDRWQMMLDECQRYATLAARTNTPYLRVFGGSVPKDLSRDEARSLAQRHLRQLIKITRPHRCRPLLETHDAWSTSDECLELLHEFSPDDTGVIWDLEHPYRRGELPEITATRLAKYIRHVHAKDSTRAGAAYHAKLLGQGDLPLPQSFAALKSIGYDAWICLETEKRWHPTAPDPEQSLPQFADYMRTHWK